MTPLKKTVQIIHSLKSSNGGPSYAAKGIFDAFERNGSPSVILSLDNQFEELTIAQSPRRQLFLGSTWLRFLKSISYLLTTKERFELFYIHGLHLPISWGAGIVALMRGTPYVVQLHGTLEDYEFKRQRLKKIIFMRIIGQRFLRKAQIVITASKAEAETAKKNSPKSNIVIIPLGVSLPRDIPPKTALSFSDHFHSTPLNKRLLFLGRLAKKKNPQFLLDLLKELPDIHLVFAGPDDHFTSTSLISRIDPQTRSRVTFTGEVQSIEKTWLMNNCRIFLLPSDNENFGITLAEACCMGMLCVVTHSVATSIYVAQFGNGYILHGTNLPEWKEAIRTLISRHHSYSEIASLSQTAKNHFSWDVFLETLMSNVKVLS